MHKTFGLLPAAILMTLPCAASAAGPTLSSILTNSGISASGDMEASFTHGFNKGQTLGTVREFDTTGDSFTFNQALLNVSYLPSNGFGAATTFLAGNDGKVVSGTYGDGSGNFALNQAYVQYAHGPISVMAGRFNTLSGAEVIQADGNTNISRSILYYAAEPFVHTGIRASYSAFGGTLYLGLDNTVYAYNAPAVANDTNKQKAIETGIGLPTMGPLSVSVFNYYTNDATSGGTPGVTTKEELLDFVATITATDKLSFMLNGDLNHSFGGDVADSNVYGLAAYANYTLTNKWKASLRGELVHTRNAGYCGTAISCNLSEVTATAGYTPISDFTLLGEFRYDMSQAKSFPDGLGPMKDNQGDISIAAIYSF